LINFDYPAMMKARNKELEMNSNGLEGVVVADTALSDVDGERGRLVIRGHDVEELALHHDFESACALLWSGDLPDAAAHADMQAALGRARGRAFARLPLLGDARVTDLAVNVILPWLWVRAAEGKNEKIRRLIEQRYFAWPAAEDNSVLKLARQRLLGTSNARILKSAAAQQGLMQIVRDFCEHSNAVCADCRFPELVQGWQVPRAV